MRWLWIDRILELEKAGTDVVIVQVPLLFQAGWQDMMDEIWTVTAPREQLLERLVKRRRMTLDNAAKRIAAQGPQEIFSAQANVVVENAEGLAALRYQIQKVWAERVQAKGKAHGR